MKTYKSWDDITQSTLVSNDDTILLSGSKLATIKSIDNKVNVKHYGVKGDGVTDDTNAIQDAISSLSSSGTLFFPPGTYICNSTLDFDASASLVLNNATLDFSLQSTFTDNCNIRFYGGVQTSLPTQSGDETVNNRTWSFASIHGLSVGDVIVVENTNDYSYSGYRTKYKKKEKFIVSKISSTTTIETCEKCKLSWTAAEATWTKLPNKTPSISGVGLIIGSGNATDGDSCIRIENVVYPRISGVRVRGADVSGINLIECYGAVVDGVHAMKEIDDGGVGLSYGLVVSSCQDVRVINSIFHGDRHGVAIGGDGLNINIHISNCTLSSNIHSSGDMHGNTIYSSYKNCYFDNGVTVSGNHNEISCCKIHINNTSNKAITLGECSGYDHVFTNNKILDLVASTYGIYENDLSDDCTEGGTLIIDGMACETPSGASSGSPILFATGAIGPTASVSYDISHVICTNHDLPSAVAIDISASNGISPGLISVRDCRLTGGITVENSVTASVLNCQIINANSNGIYVSQISGKGFIRGCTIEAMPITGKAFYISGITGSSSTCMQVSDCMLFGDCHTLLYFLETVLAIANNVRTDTEPSSRILNVSSTVDETHISGMNFTNTGLIAFYGAKNYIDIIGVGTPESNVVASVSSIYRRTDGGASTTLYVKESGSGNTGWSGK